jgi:hypothetical protein
MSEQGTADLAEKAQLDRDLTACLKPKTVQLVNNEPTGFNHWQVGMIEGDPNHTADSHPHENLIRTKLRAKLKI